MENFVPVALRKNGQMNYVTEVLVTGFQLLESRAQRAMRENNAGQDLAGLGFGRGRIAILNIEKSELLSGFLS